MSGKSDNTHNVLFVCLGNICRSPAAEGVLKQMAVDRNLSDRISIDSAGTGSWHSGESADARMQREAKGRGYTLTSRARQFLKSDFEQFDVIVAMDEENLRDILYKDRNDDYRHKVRLFSDFIPGSAGFPRDVPDPYYGGPDGFSRTLDMIEAGCKGILNELADETS